jgi:hypothetical protein
LKMSDDDDEIDKYTAALEFGEDILAKEMAATGCTKQEANRRLLARVREEKERRQRTVH